VAREVSGGVDDSERELLRKEEVGDSLDGSSQQQGGNNELNLRDPLDVLLVHAHEV
jgi:hypothetical protein